NPHAQYHVKATQLSAILHEIEGLELDILDAFEFGSLAGDAEWYFADIDCQKTGLLKGSCGCEQSMTGSSASIENRLAFEIVTILQRKNSQKALKFPEPAA